MKITNPPSEWNIEEYAELLEGLISQSITGPMEVSIHRDLAEAYMNKIVDLLTKEPEEKFWICYREGADFIDYFTERQKPPLTMKVIGLFNESEIKKYGIRVSDWINL